MRLARDLRPLARQARKEGWTLEPLGSGHVRWVSPTGELVVSSGTPSDWRAAHKLKADLRRAGLAGQ